MLSLTHDISPRSCVTPFHLDPLHCGEDDPIVAIGRNPAQGVLGVEIELPRHLWMQWRHCYSTLHIMGAHAHVPFTQNIPSSLTAKR